MRTRSISKRLTLSVLTIELVAALALIAAVAANEYVVQYKALDANLRAASNALLSAIQESSNDEVRLDLNGVSLPKGARFTVSDESGRVLGSSGSLVGPTPHPDSFRHSLIEGSTYRLFSLSGEKVIDPDRAGGIHHSITIVFGLPDRVWHEVFEAVQFFGICTFVMLGLSAFLITLIVRRNLQPIRALAHAADAISPVHWAFDPPAHAAELTELRPLTEAIQRTTARLQLSFEQQKRFTNNAAHELKTDLAIVKSSLQLLSMRKRGVADYEQGLALGLEDLTRLEHTVQKMLALARLEQAPGDGTQLCRIDIVLQDVVRHAEPLAQLSSVTLDVSRLDAATVTLDSRDAALLCSNVLLNALQHSPEHGSVEISSHAHQQEVRLFVRDSGKGVDAKDVHLLFEPFYRCDPSRSRKSGGTGLGLSICKAICDRAGGSITINNGERPGAVVEIRLPATSAHTLHPFSIS